MLENKRIPLPACVYVEVKKKFPVKKRESYAGFDLRGIWRRLASVLDIYFIYFDTLQYKLFYNCKVLEKYGFFQKHFSPIHSETNSLLNNWSIDI